MRAWVAIPLVGKHARGRFTLVDRADLPLIRGLRWYDNDGYICGSVNGVSTALHRLIMNAKRGQIVDHANGDKLDNRRENLRFASAGQNTANTQTRRAVVPYRGIAKCQGGWRAHCQYGVEALIATAPTPEAAAELYDQFARRLHGPFARLNFPRPGERAARSAA